MRVASWESSPGALAAFLNGTTALFMADLYTLTLTGGGILRYTSADVPVMVAGNTYGLGPAIKRGTTKLAVGIAVDTLQVTLNADPSVVVGGVPLLPFIAGGGLDNAVLSLDRAFAAAPGSPWIGTLNLFQGRVSDATASRYESVLTVASASELLNVMIPRNVYQPGCLNTLYDSACGLSKDAYGVAATASSASDATQCRFNTEALGQVAGWFALGWAVGVAGANAGVGRTIKTFVGAITTIQPWPSPVAPGDTFTCYAGCDKSQATCTAKFNNVIHFRGQPYVPAALTVT